MPYPLIWRKPFTCSRKPAIPKDAIRLRRRLALTIDLGRANDRKRARQRNCWWIFMAQIGVELTPIYNSWPAFLDRLDAGQVQLYQLGWVADYPDAENFLQLFYSPNRSPGRIIAITPMLNAMPFTSKFALCPPMRRSVCACAGGW